MSSAGGSTAALRRQRARSRQRIIRRVVAIALALILLIGSAMAVYFGARGLLFGPKPSPSGASVAAGSVEFLLQGQAPLVISVERARELEAKGRLPLKEQRRVRVDNLTQTLRLNEAKLKRRLAALGPAGGGVTVPEKVVVSRLDVPVVQQAYRNNCETAALSMLLASVGINEDQDTLQTELARARPLDPEVGADGQQIWGDPNRGFVGRYDGGGPAGGFGVFQAPVLDLAKRFAEPVDLSGKDPSAIYHRLLRGHAVMSWIGLSDGPYASWVSPEGNQITVNFGEHTVVLTGLAGDRIFVNDPIDGLKKVWTKDQFESQWKLLGRRAVSL